MTNLLGQAINFDDSDAAAKLMWDSLGAESSKSSTIAFRKSDPLTQSSASILSDGCKGRRVIWSKSKRAKLSSLEIWHSARTLRLLNDVAMRAMVLRSADEYEQLADRAEATARAVPQSKQY